MILARSKFLLTIAALAMAATAAASASVAASMASRLAAQREAWTDEVEHAVAQAIAKADFAGERTHQLRMAPLEETTYSPAMTYLFLSAGCSGNAWAASYYSAVCTPLETGGAMLFSCASSKCCTLSMSFEIQSSHNSVLTNTLPATTTVDLEMVFWINDDCSGAPYSTTPITSMNVGCNSGQLMECSSDLKYGTKDAIMTGSYADNTCDTPPYYVFFEPAGCNGSGNKNTCADGTLTQTSYAATDCSGAALGETTEIADVCALKHTNGTSVNYEMISCSTDNFSTGDDDDSAPRAVLSWLGALVASIMGYVLTTRA